MLRILCGHYGVGKTNYALNLALDAARAGKRVTLVDLDIVNPYFRSSEYRTLLEEAGVRLIAPVFAEAGSSLDVPSLTGAVAPAIQQAQGAHAEGEGGEGEHELIIDVGGDDAGATALGRFARFVKQGPYEMRYVVNPFRNLTQDAGEAVEVLREIELKSRLEATGIVSNAHLKEFTDLETVERGLAFACEVARATGLPLVCATVPKTLFQQEKARLDLVAGGDKLYPVQIYVKTPWE